MNRLRNVVNNMFISLIGQAVTWASTLILTIAYGRFLSDSSFGELYFAITFVLLAGFPLEFGFNQQLTREIAQEPHKALRYFSNTILIKSVLWLLLYSFILVFCWLLGYNLEVRILVAICGVTLLSTATANTLAALHYSFGRTVYPALGLVLEKGLSTLIGVILLRNGFGVESMALVLLGGSLVSTLWQGFWFFRLVGVGFTLDRALIRELLRGSIPFLTYGVLGVIYYRLDTVLLSFMTNTAVVGWYGAGYRLFDTLVFLPNLVIGAIMYPVFSKLSVSSEAKLKMAVEKSMNFLLFCGLPITTLLIVTAPNIIGLLYHQQDFLHSIPALQSLAPGLVFLYINTVLSSILISTKREKKIMIMAAIALLFNLTCNLILIPLYQHVGAAVVTSLTEFLLFCIALMFVPRSLLPIGSVRVAFKALLASLAMGLVSALLLSLSSVPGFFLMVVLPAALLVYLGVAMLLRTIPAEDMQALFSAIREKKSRAARQSDVEQAPGLELE